MITLHNLPKTTHRRKRVGRGISAGQGKTAGRGTKGQKSRSGYNLPNRFEGGQTTLFARLPKIKGGSCGHGPATIALNLDQVDRIFKDGEKVTPATLKQHGVIKSDKYITVKILGRGKLTKKVDLSACKLSASAAKHTAESLTDIVGTKADTPKSIVKKKVK